MISNYFNSPDIHPKVLASGMNAVFANGDVLFDWASFEIPRGAAKLLGATISIRRNKVAAIGSGIDLVFARDTNPTSQPPTLGPTNLPVGSEGGFNRTDIIAVLPTNGIHGHIGGDNVTYQGNANFTHQPVLVPLPITGANVGYDKYWVGGVAAGAIDLRSLVAIGPGAGVDISGSDGNFDVIDGTDPTLVFAVGDVLHAQDDIIVGEIGFVATNNIIFKHNGEASASVDGSYVVPASIGDFRIQNGAGATGDLSENDLLYNINPIRITLHFEK